MNGRMLVPTTIMCVLSGGGVYSALAQGIDVSIEADRISLVANDASLASIAAQLAERTGVPFILSGDGDPRVSVEIIEEPLEKVVAQLTSNYLLKRRNNRPGAEIVEVMLLTDDSASTSNTSSAGDDEFLPSGDPAPEFDTPDDGSEQFRDDGEQGQDGGDYFDDPNAPADDQSNGSDGQQYGPGPDAEFDYTNAVKSGVDKVRERFTDQPDLPNGEPLPYTPDDAEQ